MYMSKENIWYGPLIVFIRISTWIVFPIVGSLLLGKWLDQKFSSGQTMFLILAGISVIITFIGIWIEMKVYIKKIESEDEKS